MHKNKDVAINKTHWITSQSLIHCNNARQFMIEKDLEERTKTNNNNKNNKRREKKKRKKEERKKEVE